MHTTQTNTECRPLRGNGSVYLRGRVWWICYMNKGKKVRESASTTNRGEAETLLRCRCAERPPKAPRERSAHRRVVRNALKCIGKRAKKADGFVYIIKPLGFDFVKIGRTSSTKTLAKRISSLQCAWPVKLKAIKIIPANTDLERDLHRAFANCRAEGEWFHLTPTLRAFIDRVDGRRMWNQLMDQASWPRFDAAVDALPEPATNSQ